MNKIKIVGACTHNLKNININIPNNKLIVVSGISGSGKSSLVFNTLYAEGQHRYTELLPIYNRQFLSLIDKPDVNYIEGLSPTIFIEQKLNLRDSRSTVGTITEINDYLCLLFAHVGERYCPNHNLPLVAQTISQMVDNILLQLTGKRLMILAPMRKEHKGEHNTKALKSLISKGYVRVRIDGKIYNLFDLPKLEIQKEYNIEVVIDRLKIHNNMTQRLAESFENALEISNGTVIISDIDDDKREELIFSINFVCPTCGYSMPKLEPCLFSFNNPSGACQNCNGIGMQQYFDPDLVIKNPELSLVNGAIPEWSRCNFYYLQILKSLADHYKFDLESPWANLSKKVHRLILYGSEKEKIEFKYIKNSYYNYTRYHAFDGVLHDIERHYKETESNILRKDLSKLIRNQICRMCLGTRLRREVCYVLINNVTLPAIHNMSINHVADFFKNLTLSKQKTKAVEDILKAINNRLNLLIDIGLNYLTLSRSLETLSSGELQRIRLVSQIKSNILGIAYMLDEPSIGLHQRDNEILLKMLIKLRNLGNTVILVEHDANAIRAADHIIDIGPGAGIHGGQIIAEGSLETIIATHESLTGQYMSGQQQIAVPNKRTSADLEKVLKITGIHKNNLKDVTLTLPVGLFTCITGVSGSGKSTLIKDSLFPVVHNLLNKTNINKPIFYHDIYGIEYFNKVILIDQRRSNCTSHSIAATYIGLFRTICELFSSVKESRLRGYTNKRFSLNVYGGRCESCNGNGLIKVKMQFLPNVYVLCDQCNGKRYNRETLEIRYRGKTIYEVLDMTIEEACKFFDVLSLLSDKLRILIDIGLAHVKLGQVTNTLSSGEAQRMKLARSLSKINNGKTLYILDEPTIGLHFVDVKKLLDVLFKLRNQGNTIVVIEHNLDVIKSADWIVDLGPEGGSDGGKIIISGTPERIAECEYSYTANSLKSLFNKHSNKIYNRKLN